MLDRIFESIIYSSGSYSFSVGMLLGLILLILIARVFWRLTKAKWRIDFFNKYNVDTPNRRRFEKYLRQLVILVATFLAIRLLKLDYNLFSIGEETNESPISIRYSITIIALIVLVLTWLTEWFFSNILINKYEKDRENELSTESDEPFQDVRAKITKLVQYIVVIFAAIAVIQKFGLNFEFFSYTVDKEDKSFTIDKILIIVLIFLVAQVISWIFTQVVLFSLYKKNEIAQGSRFAINQLLKYVIYSIATFIALKSIDVNMTLILGGAAALLVGVGLGLQQTFNDFFSGLVLLFERSVSVGDVMDLGNDVGEVKKIGLRSSIIETRANVSIIVPNSKLVNENVRNWTHFVDHGRFQIDVGVAYGSDTALVKKILLTAVNEHHNVLDFPVPFVRFGEFGDSSLNFSVFFFSSRFMILEDIKSDIRFRIDELFREKGVEIPFPQRDVWMRKGE